MPQTMGKPVEVIVIDNASPDDTPRLMGEFGKRYQNLRYYRNESNFGYSGNQARCIEYASGEYIAILCDDDVYLPGAVDAILGVIARKEYAFIGLNYSAFVRDPMRPVVSHVAPVGDREFPRAFDAINHPSVGHFSGFVFNARLAKAALAEVVEKYSVADFERFRGVLGEIAIRATARSSLPSFFVGHPVVGACQPLEVDYDSLQHLCLDYYEWSLEKYREGLINEADLAYRRQLVVWLLPKALCRNACYLDSSRLARVRDQLESWFGADPLYRRRGRPVLKALSYAWIRLVLRGICACYRLVKRVCWRFRG